MQNQKSNSWIKVGKIGRPYGVKGFVKIHSFTEPTTNIIKYQPWFDKHQKPLKLIECKALGSKVIALFEENETPETHSEIWIARTQLPPLNENEYYWTDLIGLNVYNQEEQYLGDVVELFNTGANDVVVVKKKNEKHEILIPYVLHKYIIAVNLAENVMRVDWNEI